MQLHEKLRKINRFAEKSRKNYMVELLIISLSLTSCLFVSSVTQVVRRKNNNNRQDECKKIKFAQDGK